MDRERILIVDDDQFNIDAAKIVMKTVSELINPNSICDEALDGEQAVKIIKDDIIKNGFCSYFLILMDKNMPV